MLHLNYHNIQLSDYKLYWNKSFKFLLAMGIWIKICYIPKKIMKLENL